MQADRKILAGGSFTTLAGQSRTNLARLNADGTLDIGFNPGANGVVYSLAVQADGRDVWWRAASPALGGQQRYYIGRLSPDGALDIGFNPGAVFLFGNVAVYSVSVQADGKVLVGGDFTTLAGKTCSCIGRLNSTEPATQSLTCAGSAITWLRGGSSPEVWRTAFDFSTNSTDWVRLGAGARVNGGWQLTNVFVPANSTLRARGFVTGGYHNGCSYLVESTLLLSEVPPVILVNGRQLRHLFKPIRVQCSCHSRPSGGH